jgi:hypothetical protein
MMSQEKRPWHAPELIDVGDVADLTEGMDTNVGEGTNPASWRTSRIDGAAEVELENG